MGQNIPQQARSTPPQPSIGVLKHGVPAPSAQGRKPERSFKGASQYNPLELSIPIDSARIGGTAAISMNGKTERLQYPACVRHNELMHFFASDGCIGYVKIKVTTLPGSAAVAIFCVAALLLLVLDLLHISFVDAWLAGTGIGTGFEWYVVGVVPILAAIHLLMLFRYQAECRKQRPLPEDNRK